jgi:histidine ammonia-lyase
VAAARRYVRTLSARLEDDRSLSADIERVAEAVADGAVIAAVELEIGELR